MPENSQPIPQETTITLKVGQSYTIELPGRGSAGYAWQVSMAEADAQSLVNIKHRTSSPPPLATAGGSPPSSYSLNDIFEVQGLAPGKVTIKLTLCRSWEQDTPPAESVTLNVVIINAI
jgi:predicted secreted protein